MLIHCCLLPYDLCNLTWTLEGLCVRDSSQNPMGRAALQRHVSCSLEQQYALLKQHIPRTTPAWHHSSTTAYVRSTIKHYKNETSSSNNWIPVTSKACNLFVKSRSYFLAATALHISSAGVGTKDGQHVTQVERWSHLKGDSPLEMNVSLPLHWQWRKCG